MPINPDMDIDMLTIKAFADNGYTIFSQLEINHYYNILDNETYMNNTFRQVCSNRLIWGTDNLDRLTIQGDIGDYQPIVSRNRKARKKAQRLSQGSQDNERKAAKKRTNPKV